MTSDRADEPATPQQHHGVPGKTLAAQREAMGWTVEQVADQLKLAVRQVIALEAGDYAALPSPAVTRGFVRAYAKILKLDATPLVAQIEIESPAPADAPPVRREKPASFSEVRFPSHGRRSALPLGTILAAIVVAGAAAAAWKFGLLATLIHREAPAVLVAPAGSVPAPAPAASESLQTPSVPLISVPPPASASATAPATGNGAPPPAAAPATAPAAPAAPPPSASAAGGANALVFTVNEDSWIDVRPAKGGKALLSRLVKAGSTETVDVAEPLKVVVGNTHGVSASLRGNVVQLPGKTARINLQ